MENYTSQPNIDLAPHHNHHQSIIHNAQSKFLPEILIAYTVIESGVPNKMGCRIPIKSTWNIPVLQKLLAKYHDKDVVEWLQFSFSISRDNNCPDPIPATTNHMGALMFPHIIEQYIDTEIRLGVAMGPFSIPPFINRIGISPLSTRKKRDSMDRHIILDLSFPIGHSVNDGIDKNFYCGEQICLTYPTIDTLAERVATLGVGCLMWCKDLQRFFRQLPLCPWDYSLIGYRWNNMITFDKSVPMGLRSMAYAHKKLAVQLFSYTDSRSFGPFAILMTSGQVN